MTDNNLRDIASRCEAKLHGFRRTADGVVVSFVLHPAEVPPVLALDPLGTRYMLAFVAISDDETPIPPDGMPGRVTLPSDGSDVAPDRGINRGNFTDACLTPKARYAAMTAGEQAVQRSAMLPKDERFRVWANQQLYGPHIAGALNDETAADYIRMRCCRGQSRKLIAEDPEAMDKFIALETAFKIAVGEIAEPR